MTIDEYRRWKGYTHEKMAELLNISLSYYYAILSGKRKPGRNLISRIKEQIPQIDIDLFLT